MCTDYIDEINQYVRKGQLSLARFTAVEAVSSHPECERNIAKSYAEVSDELLQRKHGYLSLVESAAQLPSGMIIEDRLWPADSMPCWDGSNDIIEDASNRWDECCSAFSRRDTSRTSTATPFSAKDVTCKSPSGLPLCCDFFAGSSLHLRLPALREVALNVRVSVPSKSENATAATASTLKNFTLSLEQDGFLRPFDVSSILWPAGYLLTICAGSPMQCGASELLQAIDTAVGKGQSSSLAIELGAGIGGPSISLSLFIQQAYARVKASTSCLVEVESPHHSMVVATDNALHSLALITANALSNHASVDAIQADYTNLTALAEIRKEMGGFAVVLGSSLQAFFDGTDNPGAALWSALDVLLDQNNPDAVAVLSHTRTEQIKSPKDSRYTLCRRISGDVFGMQTRSGDTSDFGISFFQRRQKQPLVQSGVQM